MQLNSDVVSIYNVHSKDINTKLNFIENIINKCNFPANFVKLPNSNEINIFYRDGKQEREWLVFQDNRFFCVFCICFSKLGERNLFVKGVEYVKGNRVSDKLNRHEKQTYHILSKTTYSDLNERHGTATADLGTNDCDPSNCGEEKQAAASDIASDVLGKNECALSDSLAMKQYAETKEVVKIITEIIIFIASHGQCNINLLH